jgi:carboxylesterase type B
VATTPGRWVDAPPGWPANATRFTPAYLTGAVTTDSGRLLEIGGCANRRLTMDFARYTRTWAYEFAHRTGPGLTPEPAGYVWGAGHAAELAYLFPSFDNGTPIAPTFDAGERRLAAQMKSYWGTFARTGRPDVLGQPHWASYDETAHVLSLRSGNGSQLVSDATIAAEHQCGFWDDVAS